MTGVQVVPTTPANANEMEEQRQAIHEENVRLLTTRVHAIKSAKADAVAETRALRAVAYAAGDNHPAQTVLVLPNGMKASIGEVAHDQFAQRLKIDKRYYDRMNAEAPELLAQNLNYWFIHTSEERLLRFLKADAYADEDRRVMASLDTPLKLRGVLGKGYRTIDDADLVDAILPTLVERGATLQEFSIDDRRLHAAFYTVARDVQDIRRQHAEKHGITIEELDARNGHVRVNGKDIAWVNEMVASGVVIRHSEVGFASLGAAFVQKVMKCLNRMVEENSIAIRHVGGKNGAAEDDVRFISDGTQLMENAALLGRVQDTIAAQFEETKVVERATRLLVAKTETVDRPKDKPLFEFVGNLGLGLGFNETQIETLKEETQRSIIEERGENRFAFIQGITATARQMTDYDRRLEVERQAFAFLSDDATALLKVARDAERTIAKRRN